MLFGFGTLRQNWQEDSGRAVSATQSKLLSLNGVNDEPRAARGFRTFLFIFSLDCTIRNNTRAHIKYRRNFIMRPMRTKITTETTALNSNSCKTQRKCESVMQNVVNLKSITDEKIIRRFSCWWAFLFTFSFVLHFRRFSSKMFPWKMCACKSDWYGCEWVKLSR